MFFCGWLAADAIQFRNPLAYHCPSAQALAMLVVSVPRLSTMGNCLLGQYSPSQRTGVESGVNPTSMAAMPLPASVLFRVRVTEPVVGGDISARPPVSPR